MIKCLNLKLDEELLISIRVSCSQNNGATVPIDVSLGPLSANNGIDRNCVLLMNSTICTTFASGDIFSWFYRQDNVILLPRQLIVVDHVERSTIRIHSLWCEGKIGREEDAIVWLRADNPDG